MAIQFSFRVGFVNVGKGLISAKIIKLNVPDVVKFTRGKVKELRAKEVIEVKFSRITVEADRMDGVPCIRGLRIPVATVVGMIADGMSEEEILKAYPDLGPEDIREALRYAAEAVKERELPLVSTP